MIVGYAYYDDGYSYRLSWGDDIKPGEIWFQYQPSSDQLNAMFPNYANGSAVTIPVVVGGNGLLEVPVRPAPPVAPGSVGPPQPPWGNKTGGPNATG